MILILFLFVLYVMHNHLPILNTPCLMWRFLNFPLEGFIRQVLLYIVRK